MINAMLTGSLTIGQFVVFMSAVIQTRGALTGFISVTGNIYEGLLYMRQMFSFLDRPVPMALPDPANALSVRTPFIEGIQFRNVSFRYPGSETWVLKDVSFSIRPEESIALVGFNGAGKTTIVKLLTRLYDPTDGSILLDGIDIREYDIEDYRKHIAVTFQDFSKYDLSVKENIGLGDLSRLEDLEAIREAARKADADNLISQLPRQYD